MTCTILKYILLLNAIDLHGQVVVGNLLEKQYPIPTEDWFSYRQWIMRIYIHWNRKGKFPTIKKHYYCRYISPTRNRFKGFQWWYGRGIECSQEREQIFYLMGYYKINLLNYGKHVETNEFVDLLHSYSFICLINRPTRIKKQSATLIDNIYTNKHDDLANTFQWLIHTDISDHYPMIHIDYSMKERSDSYRIRRIFSRRNKLQFYN